MERPGGASLDVYSHHTSEHVLQFFFQKKKTRSECWEQSGVSSVDLRLMVPKHLPHSPPCHHAGLLAR